MRPAATASGAAGVLLALLLAAGCSDGTGGCRLSVRSGGDAATCHHPPQCLQAREDPDVPYRWILLLQEYWQDGDGNDVRYTDDVLREHWHCVTAILREHGVEDIVPFGPDHPEDVWATATFAQVESVLGYEVVRAHEVDCVDPDCGGCSTRDVDACGQDAFCTVVSGFRADTGRECFWPEEPAGCKAWSMGCGASVSYALDPDGRCWSFGNTCLPTGWRELSTREADDAGCAPYDEHWPPCD